MQPAFKVSDHRLDGNNLTIHGQRLGRPNKRFTLAGLDLKIVGGRIELRQKSKVIEYEIDRVNYLPTKKQTRLHTSGLLYPGSYKIELKLAVKPDSVDFNSLFI